MMPNEIDGDEFLAWLRLLEISHLPKPSQQTLRALLPKFTLMAEGVVEVRPEGWSSYCMKPVMLFPSPTNPLADHFADTIFRNLDYEIERQDRDGSWAPYWSWGQEAWAEAETEALREWRGILTLEMLKAFRDYDRLE